jgi:D-3-phosphoglycerate dehydrogenase
LGEAKVNIASFALGRSAPGADAIALVEVDGEISESVLAAIRKLPLVRQANALSF